MARRTICRSGQVGRIYSFFFQNIALLFLPQERILVNRFGSRGLSKFVLETWLRKCIDREGPGRRAKLYPFIQTGGAKYCGFIITEVSNNGGDGLLTETSLKKSRCFKLYRAYSISSNSPNASNFFFWRWILTDCVKILEKKKKVVVLCVHPQKNVKLGIFTL